MSTILVFCWQCNNLLQPKENKEEKKLFLACRVCEHQELATRNCVYRHEIRHDALEKTQFLEDYVTDPTLPRTKVTCPDCSGREAVYFQIADRGEEGQNMCMFYVCLNPACRNRWREGDAY